MAKAKKVGLTPAQRRAKLRSGEYVKCKGFFSGCGGRGTLSGGNLPHARCGGTGLLKVAKKKARR